MPATTQERVFPEVHCTGLRPRLAAFLVLALLAACTAWADQVTLKNGDRVTGSIVKKDGNNLTVKTDLMGVVTIPWDQVTEIKSAGPLNVILVGQTATPPAVIKATIASNNGQITLSAAANRGARGHRGHPRRRRRSVL
jgi:hypothetical protein